MKFKIVLSIWCFGTATHLAGQSVATVTFSPDFQNALEILMKSQVRQTILARLDPLAAIIAADLVDQVVRGSNREEIIKSAVDVSFTLTQFYNIHPQIEALYHQNQEISRSFRRHGMSEKEFLAYSTLYFYYSERIKYNLSVSPEIFRLTNSRRLLDTIRTANGKKWVTLVSQELVRARREQGKFINDVRLSELLKFAASTRLFKPQNADSLIISAWYHISQQYSTQERQQLLKQLGLNDSLSRNDAQLLILNLTRLYRKGLLIEDSLSFAGQLFQSIQPVLYYPYLDPEGQSDLIFTTTVVIIENFAQNFGTKRRRFEYCLALGGSTYTGFYRHNKTHLSFSLLDQIRYAIPCGNGSLFIFGGGFIEPIWRKFVADDSVRIHPLGCGYSRSGFFLSVNLGLPYPEFQRKAIAWGLSFGYEFPLELLYQSRRR